MASEQSARVAQCEGKLCTCVNVCSQMNLADFTDNQWVTCFQDTAEQILGKNAQELGELKEHVS